MQGSYNQDGLPRPYYMKPAKSKKGSPYDKVQTNYFNSPRRKLSGYIIMLFFFCLGAYWLGQSMRIKPDYSRQLIEEDEISLNDKVNDIVGTATENDRDSDNAELANGLALDSKGTAGKGVLEAPKGGVVNEASYVGNDEDEIIHGKSKKTKSQGKYSNGNKIDPNEII